MISRTGNTLRVVCSHNSFSKKSDCYYWGGMGQRPLYMFSFFKDINSISNCSRIWFVPGPCLRKRPGLGRRAGTTLFIDTDIYCFYLFELAIVFSISELAALPDSPWTPGQILQMAWLRLHRMCRLKLKLFFSSIYLRGLNYRRYKRMLICSFLFETWSKVSQLAISVKMPVNRGCCSGLFKPFVYYRSDWIPGIGKGANRLYYHCLGSQLSRAIDKISTWQHPDGGFGGGPGQAAHLLATYASVCALAIAGRPGPGGGWDQIDRWAINLESLILAKNWIGRSKKMYKYFMSLKQKDGSFLVAHHAEVDVRSVFFLHMLSLFHLGYQRNLLLAGYSFSSRSSDTGISWKDCRLCSIMSNLRGGIRLCFSSILLSSLVPSIIVTSPTPRGSTWWVYFLRSRFVGSFTTIFNHASRIITKTYHKHQVPASLASPDARYGNWTRRFQRSYQ